MANKDKESLEVNITKYTKYFKEDLDAIEEELEKSKGYSKIIDQQIDLLNRNPASRGVQHYIGESLTNAVALQTQRENLRKDRYNIKKSILDYALKFADDSQASGTDDIMAKIDELLAHDKKNAKEEENPQVDQDADSEIDTILNEAKDK